jgi:hypothetical protein
MSHSVLQHPMSSDPALREKAVSYVLVDGSEVTVYADTRVSCPARVRLTGKWTSASGDKGGQHVVDRQFAAARWECIP